jgi:hypothetical protein
MDFFTAIILVMSCHILIITTSIGIGLTILSALQVGLQRNKFFFTAFWIGWGSIVGFLQIWQIFLPVNLYALAIVLTASLIGFGFHRSKIKKIAIFFSNHLVDRKLYFFGLTLAVLWIANIGIGTGGFVDIGMYHLNQTRWLSEYKLISGLGNFNPWMALNSSYFLYTALLNVGWFKGEVSHISNAPFIIVLVAQSYWHLLRLWKVKGKDSLNTIHVFWSILLIPIIGQVILSDNTSSDVPLLGLIFVIISLTLQAYFIESKRDFLISVSIMTILSSVALTVKVNVLFFVTVTWLISMVIIIRKKLLLHDVKKMVFIGISCILFLILPSFIRGIITSGYPLYPAPVFGFAVDWAMPIETLLKLQDAIVFGCRMSAKKAFHEATDGERFMVMHTIQWMKPWLVTNMQQGILTFIIPSLLSTIGMIFIFIQIIGNKIRGNLFYILILPIIVELCFLLIRAPFARYMLPYWWGLSALTGSFLILSWNRKVSSIAINMLMLVTFGITLAAFNRKGVVKEPGPFHGLYTVPVAEYDTIVSRSGFQLFAPKKWAGLLWNIPLPSTAFPNPDIRLRGVSIEDGFQTAFPPPGKEFLP